MNDLKKIASFDNFFFYGLNDFSIEIESDLMQLLTQPKKSMFYFRKYGIGIKERENFPNTLNLQVGLRYDIANGIAYMNTLVSDGASGTRDRRIASSQFSIEFIQNAGNLDVKVLYFVYSDSTKLNVFTTGV